VLEAIAFSPSNVHSVDILLHTITSFELNYYNFSILAFIHQWGYPWDGGASRETRVRDNTPYT